MHEFPRLALRAPGGSGYPCRGSAAPSRPSCGSGAGSGPPCGSAEQPRPAGSVLQRSYVIDGFCDRVFHGRIGYSEEFIKVDSQAVQFLQFFSLRRCPGHSGCSTKVRGLTPESPQVT